MKKYFKIIISLFLIFNTTIFAQNESNADDFLSGLTEIYDKNFEQALIDMGYDDVIDGKVVTSNIENVTILNIANKNIKDLTGIEKFTALQKLFCQNNDLRVIYLYNLIHLNELNCSYNNLRTLDITKNNNLHILRSNNNLLKDLNLTQNKLLNTIEIQNNQLVYLNLKNNHNDIIDFFNVKNNPDVEFIKVDNVNDATSGLNNYSTWQKDENVNYSFQTKMTFCSGYTNIPDNNFEQALIDLDYDDVLDGQVLTNNICSLTSLDIHNKNIEDLTGISGFNSLTDLICFSNQFNILNISNNTALITLVCNNTNINIDISNNLNLESLNCGANHLSTLDISNNLNLTHLNCSNNLLFNLDLSNNESLIYLKCSLNHMLELDVSNNLNLEILYCNYMIGNQLSSLDLSANTALTDLDCSVNKISSLNLANGNLLTTIYCNNNELTSLGLSDNTELQYLRCQNNELTSLDLSDNTELIKLTCHDNELTSLDLQTNINLRSIDCSNNQLTSLDLRNGNNSHLYNTYWDAKFRYNNLNCIAVDNPNDANNHLGSYASWDYDDIVTFTNNPDCSISCPSPTNVTATAITNNSFTVNWTVTDPLPSNGWQLVYSTTPNFDPSNTTPIDISDPNTSSYNLSNLSSDTDYYFRVRAICEENSDWSDEGNVTTLPCLPPDNLTATNITDTSLTFNWTSTNVPDGGWQIAFSNSPIDDTTSPTDYVNDGNQLTISFDELTPSTTYYFCIRANCIMPSRSISNWVCISATTNAPPVCNPPEEVVSTITDTSVFLSWNNTNAVPEPEGGWEVSYTFGTYTDINDDGVNIIDSFITNQPEAFIDGLIPANDYTIFIQSLCSSLSSQIIAIPIGTSCSNCTSFKPQPGKEYVISAWVKEDWSNRPEVVSNVNKNNVKTMLNELRRKYTSFYSDTPSEDVVNGICPNRTVVNGLSQMNNDAANIFDSQLLNSITELNLEGELKPAIYNFRYENDGTGGKFKFQFTKGEIHWTENLVQNPGAELVGGNTHDITNWEDQDTDTDEIESIEPAACTHVPETVVSDGGLRFFSGGVCSSSRDDSIKYQDIYLDNDVYLIDNGNCEVHFGGWTYLDKDIPTIIIKYLDKDKNPITDASGNPIEETLIDPNDDPDIDSWVFLDKHSTIPARTRTIRFKLLAKHTYGQANNAFFDNVFLRIGYYSNSDAIQSFDVDCYVGDDAENNPIYNYAIINEIEEPKHYPLNNYHYKINYTCNNYPIENKYKYGANVYKFTNIITPVNKQVYEYTHTFIQLSYLNNMNIPIDSDFNRTFEPSGNIIDGWQRIQGVFKVPHDTAKVKIELVNGLDGPDNDGDEVDPDIPDDYQSDAYFDDIRIFPKDGNMKSFVYDQKTQKLMAELDENNYATFYEYDTEGGLIRVKKETEKGVFTIQETRSGNIKQE